MTFLKKKWKEIVEVIIIFVSAILIILFVSNLKMNCPEEPYGVWVKDQNIYVVMEKGKHILEYSFDGELLWTLGPEHYPKERIPIPINQDKENE
jgi:hypothetical protein